MTSPSRASVIALVLGSGCTPAQAKAVGVAPAVDAAQPPKPVGDGPPALTFSITQIYDGQQPTTSAPWHAPGGAWTFYDAVTKGGARFSFGVAPRKPMASDVPFTIADCVLTSRDAARLTADVATTFHVAAPVAKPHTSKALRTHLAVLGDGVECKPGYGCGGKGPWFATKLLLGNGEVEVFFDWDRPDRRGEIAEKDADYDKALVDILAGL